MFRKKKVKVTFNEFATKYVLETVKAKVTLPTAELPNIDLDKVLIELLYFRLIILFFLFSEFKIHGKEERNISSLEDLIYQTYLSALVEQGSSQELALQEVSNFSKRLALYTSYLVDVDKDLIKARGIYFYLTVCFADQLDSSTEVSDEAKKEKHRLLFNLGKDAYKKEDEAWMNELKETVFIN